MCTVLQQHLNNQSLSESSMLRHVSPVRLPPAPTYSYLQDVPNMKRPVDPYDRKKSTPTMHFHVPPPEAKQQRGRSYLQQLMGRRSRSHSRTGMRVLVDQMQSQTPRPRSPHMNNEEPINLSHYPDGRAPDEHPPDRQTPIERDDFPAPPYAYAARRRHWSEPGGAGRRSGSSGESTPVESSADEDEEEPADEKLDKTETELRKISTQGGMGKVFLQEIAVEREKKKQLRHRMLDPRSAARTPTAKKEPHFRLRYESPINASPSRVADHLRPWDDELDGSLSRRSNVTTPFLPHTPNPHRVVSPVHPIRPGYTQQQHQQRAQTLPSRFSPGFDSSGGEEIASNGHTTSMSTSTPRGENIRISTTYTQVGRCYRYSGPRLIWSPPAGQK